MGKQGVNGRQGAVNLSRVELGDDARLRCTSWSWSRSRRPRWLQGVERASTGIRVRVGYGSDFALNSACRRYARSADRGPAAPRGSSAAQAPPLHARVDVSVRAGHPVPNRAVRTCRQGCSYARNGSADASSRKPGRDKVPLTAKATWSDNCRPDEPPRAHGARRSRANVWVTIRNGKAVAQPRSCCHANEMARTADLPARTTSCPPGRMTRACTSATPCRRSSQSCSLRMRRVVRSVRAWCDWCVCVCVPSCNVSLNSNTAKSPTRNVLGF